jgi:hypothetical protein
MAIARFKTMGQFDQSYIQHGTIEIDRNADLISVRPKGRRRTYTLPLSAVAEIICWRVIRAELLEKKREKALKKKFGKR